ncbi:MAG: ABC transporter permease [Deltaproteobacteria bacterium]|jgi:molybdate/tungstate transport system permease protein|nr:ABC transporter permease [Deltaproteobacteria bacterium]
MRLSRPDPFIGLAAACSLLILAFILLPLVEMITQPTAADMAAAARDSDAVRAIWLSMSTSLTAGIIALVLGTPFAYLLARRSFPGKKLVESAVDLPIMIPHPVIGIALLSLAGKNHWLGRTMAEAGIRFMGTTTGIVAVMLFVGLPFFINAAKAGFEGVPVRMEKVGRSLGATPAGAFFRITLPLTWRSIVVGVIMCMARAISEFGAIVIVAYHPMVAPVMIYERFTAYGLKYSQPVAVWLILVCLLLFLLLRLFARPAKG